MGTTQRPDWWATEKSSRRYRRTRVPYGGTVNENECGAKSLLTAQWLPRYP